MDINLDRYCQIMNSTEERENIRGFVIFHQKYDDEINGFNDDGSDTYYSQSLISINSLIYPMKVLVNFHINSWNP